MAIPYSPPLPTTQPSPSTATDPFAAVARDDLKAWIAKSGYKSVEDAVYSDMHKSTLLGLDRQRVLKIPNDANDAEGWKSVRAALGVPETPEGYGKFQPATGALSLSEPDLAAFDKAMHAAHASPAQRAAALNFYHEASAREERAMSEAYAADVSKGLGELKAEWGAAFEQNITAGEAAAKAVLGDRFMAFLKSAGVDDHPEAKRAFFAVAKAIAEDGNLKGLAPSRGALTPAEAQAEIAKINADPALFDANHPDHSRLLARRNEIYKLAYPE